MSLMQKESRMAEVHIFVFLRSARRSKGLERSLKISIPDEIYDRLEEELKELDTKQ